MKIVVLDGYTLNPGDIDWNGFKKLGELVCYDRTTTKKEETAKIIDRIADADAVITNKTPITREILDSKPKVKYIGVLATGYNVVDVDAAREKGVVVTNIPTYGTTAVAQFVFAHLLEFCHHVAHHAETVKNGRWAKSEDFCYWDYPLIELAGKTMGIIGFGRIGQTVAGIAVAFGMKVLAYDEYVDKSRETDSIKYASLDDALAKSDVISLHVPLFDSTRGLINKSTIARMKDGVIIINTSRGPLVVEEDMVEALESGKVAGFGSDVVEVEPIAPDNKLPRTRNCHITPHIAWAPKEARIRLMNIAVDNLAAFAKGSPVNVVNK
ncbi:MAG: D-2-hydroxyacid dehydrogenase [Planctomycetota bacterium]|jgi:glycerate dehydrogenase|nr:D-2-hydroxyacid dehydrogenase [Planctomycetota bacterium]MDR1520124.1 D-2-hydroxyacid dehydrogenase [Planctomycetota bacterium]